MAGRSATRVIQQQLLFAALLARALTCPAADGLTIVPGAHGPQMMLYIRQPLGAGATRIYGLRLERMDSTPALATSGSVGTAGARSIVDLQFRHASDVRVEFGRRLTWNLGRREFGPSGNQPGMLIHLPARALPSAIAARAAVP
jgi:hypothetical protein